MNEYETPTAQHIYMTAAFWAIGVTAGLPLLIWEIFDLPLAQLLPLVGSQVYSLVPLVILWFATSFDPAKSVLLASPTIATAMILPLLGIYGVVISSGAEAVLLLASMFATYLLYRRFE